MNQVYTTAGRLKVVGLGGTMRENSRSRWALEYALSALAAKGVETELLAVNELDLPMFRPKTSEQDYPESVSRLLAAARGADGMLWSTGAYHGTLAGATKNALDYFEFLAGDGYLDGVTVGLIATSGGHMAGVNAVDALVHSAHALRATVLPLKVPIGKARQAFSSDGDIIDHGVERRLEMLANLLLAQIRQGEIETIQ